MRTMWRISASWWWIVVAIFFVCVARFCDSQQRQVKIDLDCMPGWELVGQQCYKLFTNPLPWSSSDRICSSYGSKLVTMWDWYANEDIGNFVNRKGVQVYWIGFIGADRINAPPNDNRVLMFSGGMETRMWVGYWYYYQPIFSDGDCVYVQSDKKGLHKWSFGPCEKSLAFLCQRPVCAAGSFHCLNGNCVSQAGVCDLYDDCGDRSDEINCTSNCAMYMKATLATQTVTYPTSGSYPDNADCSWLIEADLGYNVQLNVSSLLLESKSDELVILDGGLSESSSMELAHLSGQLTAPRYFYSSDNKMLLKFMSDGSVTNSGFSFSFRAMNSGLPPQNFLTATDVWQELTFPFYNNYLLGSQDLAYIIEAQNAQKTVAVEVLDIDLPDDAEARIRNGRTVSDSTIAVLTGIYKGNGIALSTGRYIYVALHTVRGSQRRGLKIRYKQGCDTNINQLAGYISSPGYSSSPYPNSIRCMWTVTVPTGQSVTILLNGLDIDTSDTLQIMEGNQLQGNYTGKMSPNPVRINSGQFTVVFTSDASMNGQGFNLTFSVDCMMPVIDLNLSDITGAVSSWYGSRFTVSCKPGSRFSQMEHLNKSSVFMACMAYRAWNVHTSPTCERILCPKAPGLLNGYIVGSTGNLSYNGTVSYQCYPGFSLGGSTSTITCDVNGQWQNIPNCQASSCGSPPPADPNGSMNVTVGSGSSYGSVVRYYCNPGYDIIGDPTLFCGSSGSWVGQAGKCTIQTCYIGNVANGAVSSNKVQVGGQITLTCNSGYTTSVAGASIMTCNNDRTLTPQLSCQNINECADNRTCQQKCVDTEGGYNCSCNPGFLVTGNTCTDIDECGTNNPCNGSCINTAGSYQCLCPTGFTLFVANGIQGQYIPPSEDGTQPGDVYRINQTCVRNMCPAPLMITNANLLSQKTSFFYRDTVMFKCQIGYILSDAAAGTLVCSENGNWTGLEIKCLRATCPVDPVPVNLMNPGSLIPQNGNINYGEDIIIMCNVPGGAPQSFNRTRQCTLIGSIYKLSGNVGDYECGFISCGRPQNQPGSSYTSLSSFYYGSSFIFGCQADFKLEGASVVYKNTTVTCQSNGQWDFGSLTCSGFQCLDPGQPALGEQVLSDYRIGQLVTFNCSFPGYSLSPPYPLSCYLAPGSIVDYNGSVPICVDTQKPNITNCPTTIISVPWKIPIGSMVPELKIQDNGGIRSMMVSPAWPPSQFYFTPSQKNTLSFTYTVTDYGGNSEMCRINVTVKDETLPTIICPRPYVYTFRSPSDIIRISFNRSLLTVTDDVTPPDQLMVNFANANYTFTTTLLLRSFPPTHYASITATVTDAALNKDSCNFGVFFQPDVCSPYYLRTPPHATINCSAVGSGYSCVTTCQAGYILASNVQANSVTKSCPGQGSPFTPDIDVKCVNLTSLDGSYRLEYSFTYVSTNASNSTGCQKDYEEVINSTLSDLNRNNNLTILPACEYLKANASLKLMTIKPAEGKIVLLFNIGLERRSGFNYTACANLVKFLMDDPEDYLGSLQEFKPLKCESFTLTPERSLVYEGYYCDNPKHQLVKNSQNIGYCMVCPEGTYSVNGNCTQCPLRTYNNMTNMDTCQPCPSSLGRTSTYSTGAVSINECAPECIAGTVSSNGLPPCYQCLMNTYSVNSTICLPCPAGTLTKQRGSKDIAECRASCVPGTFNEIDGHEDCKRCPKNYYSDMMNALACNECNSDEYTVSDGATSRSDCQKLSTSPCTVCRQGRCVQPMNHVISCICNDGWYGELCDKAFNPCDSHPCYNGGVCLASGSSYTCSCPAGSSGQNCEEIIESCVPGFCQNNGMCKNLLNRGQCNCLPGFTGDRCQMAQDICSSMPCQNGGQCNSLGNVRYSCTCPIGFTGANCETSSDDCYGRPCRNNGQCRDGYRTVLCDCDPAYTGQYCATRRLFCNTANCGPGAQCFEDPVSNYTCVCSVNTDYNAGAMTCSPKDFCAGNPCKNNATCINGTNSFTCQCPFGYGGSMCQNNINDCVGTPCLNGGKCMDKVGGYDCDCSGTGYGGARCDVLVNECQPSPCNATGMSQCVDLINAYRCDCRPGFTGKNCETEINECDSTPCLHNAACMNLLNDFMCQCPVGWTGKVCETEVTMCTPSICQNGAQCYNYFNGYFCDCKANTYDRNCSNSVSVCQVANPCIHGNCQDANGNALCSCNTGYQGERCQIQQDFCSANMNTCKNNGQCVPQLDSYSCICQQGYSSGDCSFVVDNCSSRPCPANAICLNVDSNTYCRCPLDKEGPNCDKDWNQNFDLLFDHEKKTGMAYLQYPVTLNSSSFSISLWLQYGKKGGTGALFTLMTVPNANSLKNKQRLLWIDEKALYYNVNGNTSAFHHDINYNVDGQWHYMVINVNRMGGELNIIVDTINSLPFTIAPSTNNENIWLALGVLYDPVADGPVKDKGFYGKLSRFTVYSRTLKHREEVTIDGNNNVDSLFADSILRWSSEFKYSVGVIRIVPSEADASCPLGYTNYDTCNILLPGKNVLKIANGQCPRDIIKYSADRLTQVYWATPTYTDQNGQSSSVTQISSLTSGDTLGWGKYEVAVKSSSMDGNTALCLFNIFVQNDNCTSPALPPNAEELQCSPLTYENYKQCSLICKNNTAPSIPSPRIHTCGPVGNFDPLNRYILFRITPCGGTTSPKHQLMINLRYSVPSMECTAVTETLEREIRNTQVNLNNAWDRVCTQSNCSDTIIKVNCLNRTTNKLELSVDITLNDTLDTVTSRSGGTTKRTEDLYRDLILAQAPGNPFDYSRFVSDAIPSLNNVSNIPQCIAPRVYQENMCADCGPGTFYNATEMECQFCPIGSFQNASAQTSCIQCLPGTTTETYGTFSVSECYMECPTGQYLQKFPNSPAMCTNCSRGFYQPQRGQFHCLPCPVDKTTKYTGTVLASDCSNDCPAGQEIRTSNNCTDCRVGYYRGPNDGFCLRCPNGTVTQFMKQTSVQACNVSDNPPGTMRRLNDSLRYDNCPIGTYQDQRWQYECIQCPAYYLTDHTGSTNISDCKFSCPAGQHKKPNEDSCVPCPAGFFRDGSNPFDLCQPCPGHYTTPKIGSTSINNCTLYRCNAGEQPNALNNGCEKCPNGTYQNFTDMPSCIPCNSGMSTQSPGATKQEDCESYCPSGSEKNGSACVQCRIGYFKNNAEDIFGNCTACRNSNYVTASVGSVSNDNCTVLNCMEGYKINQTTLTCDPCPRGTYQDKKYQSTCIQCAQNLYTRYTNSTRQEDCESYCPSGYEKNGTSCQPCARGFYKDNNIDPFMACTACDSRFVTPDGPPATSNSSCTVPNCQPGSYINGSNCTLCARGFYQDKPWQTNCTQCDTHRNTQYEGSNDIKLCLLSCAAGLENKNGSDSCDPCGVGYYKDKEGATKCMPCANFTENDIRITVVNGSKNFSECTKLVCLAGFYPLNGKCTPCNYGMYQPVRWSDTCLMCPQGNTTYMTGANSSMDCEYNCNLGEGLVNGTCRKCVVGFYNDKSDISRRECFQCPPGKITQQEGSASSSQCNITDCSTLGQYRDPSDNTCKDCPIGTYQDTVRQDSCKICPVDYTTQSVRSSSSSDCKRDCPSGYQLNSSTNTCVPCPTGSYRNKTEGNWNCVQCPPNLSTLSTGSKYKSDCAIANCNPGYGYDTTSQTCLSCPINTYIDSPGQLLPCKPCPGDNITTSTATNSVFGCKEPCMLGNICNTTSQVCVNVQRATQCQCRSDYVQQNNSNDCMHKCDIPDYCGQKGECVRTPFSCLCKDGYTGERCNTRPEASSNKETETIIIAVVSTVAGVLFMILAVTAICVMAKRIPKLKNLPTSETDERASSATRSMKGLDDYPTFAVNPAFSSKPPSVVGGPNGVLPSQNAHMFTNPTYSGDEENDPAVYRA